MKLTYSFLFFLLIISIFFYFKIDWKIKHRLKRQWHFSRFEPKKNDILFCGDSNIELLDFNLIKSDNTFNYGIAGEKINGLSKRLKKIMLHDPKQLFVLIGINDVLANRSNEVIKKDYVHLFNSLKKYSKHSNITIISLYPLGRNKYIKSNLNILNNYLREQCLKFNFNFLDVYNHLEDRTGFLNKNFSEDGIHLNYNGQMCIAESINTRL
jgi:lysophospholipase L1-like esterase